MSSRSSNNNFDLVNQEDITRLAANRTSSREREENSGSVKARLAEIGAACKFDKETMSKLIVDICMAGHSCPTDETSDFRALYKIPGNGAEVQRRKIWLAAVKLLMGEKEEDYVAETSWAKYLSMVKPWVVNGNRVRFDWKAFYDVAPLRGWVSTHLDNVIAQHQQSVNVIMKKGFWGAVSLADNGDKVTKLIGNNFVNLKKTLSYRKGEKDSVKIASIITKELRDQDIKVLFTRIPAEQGYRRIFCPSEKNTPLEVKIVPNVDLQAYTCAFFNPHHLVFTKEVAASQRNVSYMQQTVANYMSCLKVMYENFGIELGWAAQKEIVLLFRGEADPKTEISAMQMMTSDLQFLWARYRNGVAGATAAKGKDPTAAKKRNDEAFGNYKGVKATITFNI